jgi:hypothetical protein
MNNNKLGNLKNFFTFLSRNQSARSLFLTKPKQQESTTEINRSLDCEIRRTTDPGAQEYLQEIRSRVMAIQNPNAGTELAENPDAGTKLAEIASYIDGLAKTKRKGSIPGDVHLATEFDNTIQELRFSDKSLSEITVGSDYYILDSNNEPIKNVKKEPIKYKIIYKSPALIRTSSKNEYDTIFSANSMFLPILRRAQT